MHRLPPKRILEVDANAGPRTLLNAPIRSLFRGVQAARPTSAGVEASAFVERGCMSTRTPCRSSTDDHATVYRRSLVCVDNCSIWDNVKTNPRVASSNDFMSLFRTPKPRPAMHAMTSNPGCLE